MEKVIRDGKVAVLYSPGYGAGWFTWHNKEVLLFHPEIVKAVEENRREDIPNIVKPLYGNEYVCVLGAPDLQIEWIPHGEEFDISEYDGYESIQHKGKKYWYTA